MSVTVTPNAEFHLAFDSFCAYSEVKHIACGYLSSTGSLMIDRFINAINLVIWC